MVRWPFGTKKETTRSHLRSQTAQDKSASGAENWASRLRAGLSKSSTQISAGLRSIFTSQVLDEETLDALEDLLISADLGVSLAAELRADLMKTRFGKNVTEAEVKQALMTQISRILEPLAHPMPRVQNTGPECILFVGVNGSGKTTTIGKIAHMQASLGASLLMVAGDTFRAAAVEQLEIWGDRTGVEVIRGKAGSDPASLAFEGLAKAQSTLVDMVLIDTAGRLPNHQDLMDELTKVTRVLKKRDPEAPHQVILVLDATVGQSALAQVRSFIQAVQVTGLIVTKLDGTAKGGVVVALAREFGLPIYFVGVGEKMEDLRPFKAEEFAQMLVGL